MKALFPVQVDIGLLILRLFLGLRLLYGVADNIVSWPKMLEFAGFLEAFHFPLPTASAVLSVYAQFLASLMILIGWHTRIAACIMVFNFMVALLMVHLNDSVEAMTPALAMLIMNLCLLFSGPGRYVLAKNK